MRERQKFKVGTEILPRDRRKGNDEKHPGSGIRKRGKSSRREFLPQRARGGVTKTVQDKGPLWEKKAGWKT